MERCPQPDPPSLRAEISHHRMMPDAPALPHEFGTYGRASDGLRLDATPS
jgi:hypothetical protein